MALRLRCVSVRVVFSVWLAAVYIGLDNFVTACTLCRFHQKRGGLMRWRLTWLNILVSSYFYISICIQIHALLWNDLARHFVTFIQVIVLDFVLLDRGCMLSYGNVLSLRFTVLDRWIVLVVVLIGFFIHIEPYVLSFLLKITVVAILRFKIFNGPKRVVRCH